MPPEVLLNGRYANGQRIEVEVNFLFLDHRDGNDIYSVRHGFTEWTRKDESKSGVGNSHTVMIEYNGEPVVLNSDEHGITMLLSRKLAIGEDGKFVFPGPRLPSTPYDFSLVPESFVEIIGGRPADLLENDRFRDCWKVLDQTPLKAHLNLKIAEGLWVKLSGPGEQIVLLKPVDSALEYARETLGVADNPLREGNIEIYQTDSPDLAVRVFDDDRLAVGTPSAILAHAAALNDVKPTFEPMSRQFQSQDTCAFKISTSSKRKTPRGSDNFWMQAYLNMLDITVNPLLECDYLIASVDLQGDTCNYFLTAWCSDPVDQTAAHRTMDATRGVFPNLIQSQSEGLFTAAHKQIINAVAEAQVDSLSDHCVQMKFPLQSADAVYELIRFYLFISDVADSAEEFN